MTEAREFEGLLNNIIYALSDNENAQSGYEAELQHVKKHYDDALKNAEIQRASVQKSIRDSLSQAQTTANTKADHELSYAGLKPTNVLPVSRPSATADSDPVGQFDQAVGRVDETYQILCRARRNLEELQRQIAQEKDRGQLIVITIIGLVAVIASAVYFFVISPLIK